MKVLVIDDSPVARTILRRGLSNHEGIGSVVVASDAYEARAMIASDAPDAIVLDLVMPGVDGLSFLRSLMQHFPIPTVVFSSSADAARDGALRMGAAAVVQKPSADKVPEGVALLVAALLDAVSAGARSRSREPNHARRRWRPRQGPPVIAIGSSTGGPEALETVLTAIPDGLAPIVVAQHMPGRYLEALALRLNGLCSPSVALAKDGDILGHGRVYIAPGDVHLEIRGRGKVMSCRLKDSPKVHFQRPAVDVLFDSVSRSAGASAIGVILTGMGSDGAAGLKRMRDAGAYCIGQDERTCTVYGMPREAMAVGAVHEELPLSSISGAVVELARRGRGASAA